METSTHDNNNENGDGGDLSKHDSSKTIQPSTSTSSSLNTINSESDLTTTQQQQTNDETTNNSRKRKRTSNVIFKPSTTTTNTRSTSNKRQTNEQKQQEQSTNDDLTDTTSTQTPASATKNNKTCKNIEWKVGLIVEARDSKMNWYPSRIIQIDDDKNRVKVHFHGWNSRYDQWFDKTSSDLRLIKGSGSGVGVGGGSSSNNAATTPSGGAESNNSSLLNNNKIKSLKERFNIGDKVLAKWIDNCFYSATVLRQVNKNNTLYYEVKFEADGVKKMIRYDNCKKYNQNEDQQFIIQQLAVSAVPSTIVSETTTGVISGTENSGSNVAVVAVNENQTDQQPSTTTTTTSTETGEDVKTDNSNVRKSTRVKRQRTFSDDMITDYRLNKSLTNASKKRKLTEPTTTNEQQITTNLNESTSIATPQIIKQSENEQTTKSKQQPQQQQQQIESPLSVRKKAPLGNYLKSLSLLKPNKKRDKKESISESIDESETKEQEIEDEEEEEVEERTVQRKQTKNEHKKETHVQLQQHTPKSQQEDKQKSSIKLKIKLNSSTTSLNELKEDFNKPKIETPTSVPVMISKTSAFNYQLYNKSLSTVESPSSSSLSNELIKCVYSNCNKTFRKQSLLDYHIKYHHYEDGRVVEVKPKKKREENATSKSVKSQVSTDSRQLSVEQVEEDDPYEVIHCECGRNLSEGFMIQCDQCYCWQHGDCCNISEDNPPKTHSCWVCNSSKDKIKYNSWLNDKTNDENRSISRKQLYLLLNECSQQIAYLNRLNYDFECELSILKNIDNNNNNNNIDYEKVMSNCEKLQHVIEEQGDNLNKKLTELEDKYGLDTKKLLNVDLVDYVQKLGESLKTQ